MRTSHLLSLPFLAALAACGSTTDAAGDSSAAGTSQSDTAAADTAAADTAATDTAGPDAGAEGASAAADSTVYSLDATSLGGDAMPLSALQGKVTVFVNVASKCGYTPQYAGLQKLQEELGGDDFTVVGVPSNDFGGQEPGTAEEIQAFCQANYGVTFPMLTKTGTKDGDSPLFDALAGLTGSRPNWNFCKYVVSKDGNEARFFKSGAGPDSTQLRDAIAEFRGR